MRVCGMDHKGKKKKKKYWPSHLVSFILLLNLAIVINADRQKAIETSWHAQDDDHYHRKHYDDNNNNYNYNLRPNYGT